VNLVATLLVLLAAAAPLPIEVRWSDLGKRDVVSIRANEVGEEILECLDRSKQARVRFEARLCARQSAWFDSCELLRSELHTVEFDSITESYRVVTDRYGDGQDRLAVGIPSLREAVRSASSVEALSLSFLAREQSELLNDADTYLQVRTVFSCKGAVNRTFARLSQVVTLGIVNVIESTSAWYDFDLFSSDTDGSQAIDVAAPPTESKTERRPRAAVNKE
jgi:hypothetical protein